jgi:hypothetical protein
VTITLTIEELRAFELLCTSWTNARAVEVARNDAALLAKWDAANPFPKIIPAI